MSEPEPSPPGQPAFQAAGGSNPSPSNTGSAVMASGFPLAANAAVSGVSAGSHAAAISAAFTVEMAAVGSVTDNSAAPPAATGSTSGQLATQSELRLLGSYSPMPLLKRNPWNL